MPVVFIIFGGEDDAIGAEVGKEGRGEGNESGAGGEGTVSALH